MIMVVMMIIIDTEIMALDGDDEYDWMLMIVTDLIMVVIIKIVIIR